MLPTHDLLEWSWHHFAPLSREVNFVPILEVLADHEGEAVADARANINAEVDSLGLAVGLGKRKGERYSDIFRDRIDVWRFTGCLYEPGLVHEEIRLTPLGHALVTNTVEFGDAMTRQASRLRFPRLRVRREAEIDIAVDKLRESMRAGPGVRVAQAWALAVGHLRERGSATGITGEEAARYLSGCASLSQIAKRADAIIQSRAGQPTPSFSAVSTDKLRQGRELARWLQDNGALIALAEAPVFVSDPPVAPDFHFSSASVRVVRDWQEWWGSAP
jgi:hypothetical protein